VNRRTVSHRSVNCRSVSRRNASRRSIGHRRHRRLRGGPQYGTTLPETQHPQPEGQRRQTETQIRRPKTETPRPGNPRSGIRRTETRQHRSGSRGTGCPAVATGRHRSGRAGGPVAVRPEPRLRAGGRYRRPAGRFGVLSSQPCSIPIRDVVIAQCAKQRVQTKQPRSPG
jgi:hypothetical protein